MIRFIILFSIILILQSCKESIPKEIIKPHIMQQILWDILRADALSQQVVKMDSTKSLTEENNKLTNKIYKIHKVTEQQFKKSYAYYIQHPEIMHTMLDTINAQQSRKINNERSFTNRAMTDSVK